MPEPAADHHALIVAAGSSRRLRRLTADRPKSLLPVAGRPIIGHGLDALARHGVRRLTIVIGFHGDKLVEALGTRHGPLEIDYVTSHEYATTEHGWSLYQARAAWQRERRPVLFMDADDLYHPGLLARVLAGAGSDLMLVDPALDADERDEELVLGHGGRVTGLVRGRARDWPGLAGGVVGINRFSAALMGTLFEFMEGYFAKHGRQQKYERVFDALIADTGAAIGYLDTGGLPWVNVNERRDLERAHEVARLIGRG